METAQFAILAGLSALSIALCAYLLMKIRTITYLLEQPVVKKMSPQLNLKPVKVDELGGDARPNPSRNNAPNASAPARSPRPETAGGERPPRDGNRDRGPRAERPEGGDRPPREGGFDRNGGDRGPRSDRGGDRFPRGDRGERGGRGGGDRHERGDRGDRTGGRDGFAGGDRNRTRTEAPAGEAQGDAAPRAPHVHTEAAPVQSHAPAALAPRRPLPSTVEHEVEAKDISGSDSLAVNQAAAEDSMFNRGDDSDIQHGRRHQPKKKPRFDAPEEAEVKTEETKA